MADRDAVLAAANRVALQLSRIPSEARHVTKMLMREPTLEKLTRDKQADIQHFTHFITQPEIQKPMGRYLEALKNKSKKK